MPYDKIDQLYDALKKDGAVSKSRENFRSKMLAPGKEGYQNRLQLYKALKADGAIDSPTYEEFGKRLGLHAVNNTPAPAHPQPQKPTAAPAQAATPAPNSAPATPQQKDKPLTPAQRQAMIDQVQQMQQQTQAMIADNNERMKNMKQYGFGLGFGQTKKGGVKYNPRTKKFEQTYITPTGNRYSSKALADAESFRYRKAASEPLGLNMNDQQVNDAQKPASAAVAALWKEAEAKYAADRNKNAEDVYSGNPWLHGGREMHIVDAATNSHKNEVSRLTRFDLQKMMDNAWGRVGKQMTASCYAQLKKQYPTATERQLQNSASAMARQLSDNAVYKYAVAKNTPKSTLEFFAKTAADMNLLRTINKGLARSEAGTTGDMAAYEQAMSDYGKNHRWAQIGGTVTGMMFDPTTYISGGVGSFAGKTALNIGGRIVAKKAATNVGARLFSNTLTGRVVAGVAGGAGNLGAYEGIKEGESQWLHGGHINQETGENEGYSAGDVLKSSLHGTLLGSVTGTVSPLLGNVADKWVKATSNTAGKVGIRAGELATSTVAEGTIFSIPEWISGDGDAMDVWTDNMAMMIGFKGQHMIKSAPRVIAGLRPIADPKTMQERNHNRMSFLERLRTQLDASPHDMAFTKEEREELQRYGYGDLAALFTRTPKQPKPKAKPTTTDGKVMNFDIPEAEVEDLGKQWLKTHPEFDGYDAMQRLIQDPSVSQSARAKAYYILTGRQLPMGSVTGYTTEKDENGNIFVKSVTANGEVVTNRRFADETSAKREQDKIMRQAELNSVDVGERYTEAKADNKVWDAAVEAVAPGADPETVKRNYQAAKEGDKDAIANYGQMVDAIDKFMEENRGMADAERPEAIRAAIKEETGVDVDAAIKKEPSKRTEPEQAAVEDYLKRLFPEQNLETEQPMSDDEAGAAAIYDQSRLLWDKVEQGDADAKADVDAIVLRMQEALQECEDAFGTDAEMRMAEMQDNPWALANDLELTEDQQNAVLYYINAKAAMDGVQDASNDAMEDKRREVAANVERHTHKDNGMVQPATMKVDDKPVYIVKGNVVPLPDGTGIDTQNSDQSIVICDAETGEYKFTSPDQIFNIGDAIDPQAELDEAYANIQAEHDAVLGGMENGESVPKSGESVQETPENVQNEGENVQPPMTDEQLQQYAQGAFNEATQGDGGITLPQEQVEQMQQHNQQMLEQDQQRREEEANRQPTALERVPLNEETGEPMFEKADKETALDALNEVTGGNEANTTAIVNAQVEQAQKTLDALKKKQPTKKAPSLKGSPMAMVKAQQEADANYNAAMEQYNAQMAEAEETLGAWSRIYALMNERKRAIREQREAEQRERDKQMHDAAVAQVEEQKRIAAQKAAEQAEVGTHAVNPKIKAKWNGAAKVEGNPNALTLADGSTIRGHYVLTEAGAASASHDVNNAFEPTEGFPIDENGESVNDRDYKRDTDAQRIVRDIANNYDSRALQSPVIVSKDGVVLSGNNRTMSGDIAAQQGTDKAYIDHLREFGQMYGFTPEQIDGMKHPRVVFVPDEQLPYDATTFARFNAEQQKKQSKPEHAVKLGKIVPDNVFTSITNDISRFDRLSDYYADDKAVSSAISQLLGAGVINEMQLPEMRTGNSLSAAGKELIENTLIGKVFQTSPDAVRHIISTPTLRQSVIMGLNEIAHNRTLAKSGYDLSNELGAAVDLVARAKSAHPDIFKDGMPVSPFGREQGLFDDEYGDSRVTDGTTLLLADILNSGKPSDLRKVLSAYNAQATAPAGGQLDMFTGDVTSKEEILNTINEHFRNATPREQQALVDADIAERKRIAETEAGQRGGNKATEQTEDAVQRSAEPQQPAVAETEPAKQEETPQTEEPNTDTIAEEEEEALRNRITETDEEWTEPSANGDIYKQKLLIDGKEVIKVDAPDESKNYPGTYYEVDGKQFGDLQEVVRHLDGAEQPLSAKIKTASADVNTEPTEAQKEAGNYKKGHVQVGTFDITIEQPQGSVRKGTDANGKQWESKMHNTYGYFRGTEGVDGDHIDVFLSNDIDGWNGRKVYVVDQYNPDGTFDEHKVMLGFNDMDEAKSDYLANYEKGWEDGRRIVVSATNLEDFEKWIDSSHRKTKPFAEYAGVKKETVANTPAKEEAAVPTDNANNAAYTITPATYTNKKGKTSDVSLLTFNDELTADQERAVKEFAKERLGEGRFSPARGWKDRESGGWMFRSEEDARKAAEMVDDDDAVADNQPLTAQEMRDAVEPKKPATRKKATAKKPANKVEVADVTEQKPTEPTKEEPKQPTKEAEKPKYEVSDEEMNGLMNDIRNILGIGADEGDAVLKFRDPDELTAEQRQKLMSVGQRLAMAMVERGNESFGDYASMMVKALGDKVRPWLKAFYGGLEYVPGYDKYALTPYEEVKAFDVENFDKLHKDVLAQADMIVEEGKAQAAADKANNELKAIRNEQRKETDKQTETDTAALAAEAETVASETESLAETSSDEQALNGAAERVDETLDKVNDQLALLGYYEADQVEKDFNEAYGYMRNAEKKAVKDAANLASQLIDDLGLDRYEATHGEADKKGKRKTKPLPVANIAPAGGDVTMHLPLAEGRELYVNVQLAPSAGKGITNYGGDNLEVTGIMCRVENPNASGNDRYGQNMWFAEDVTYDELLKNVQRDTYKYIPERGNVKEGEYKVGDKVQYSPDGNTWHDAVVAQPNELDGIRIDTGQAPVMWVNAHPDQLRHKAQTEPQNEDIFQKAERIAKEAREKNAVKAATEPTATPASAEQPKTATKKKASKKKVKPEQTVGNLFAGLFDETEENGLQRNDDAVRSQGVQADNSGQQQGLRGGERATRKAAAQESGRPDGGRGGQGTGANRAESAGLHGLTEPKNTRNNHSERGADHAPTSVNGRIEANIKAIELAHELLESGETATPEQMSVLRQFSGWGGLGAAFSDGGYDWKQRERNKKIRELLGEEAYEQAVMSANSAYYTPAYVVDTLWDIAGKLGFKGGNILEGSAGIGNILGQMPTDMSERSDIHAIEIDGTSGGILSLLYPDVKVDIQGFEQTRIPNGSVDLAITNVPFVTGLRVNDTTGDSDLSKKFHNIHDFCIAKNVRKLREGGLGIFISSNGTLDNSKALRDWVVNEGGSDFIGAFRMNNKTFGGTTVTSDIIVIRKRMNGQKSANAIDVSTISGERTAEYQEPGARKAKPLSMDYNKYFIEYPDHMAGEMRFAFEEGDTFRPTSKGLYPVSGKDQGKMLTDFVQSFKEEERGSVETTDSHKTSYVNDASADGKRLGEMYLKDGKLVTAGFGGYYPLDVNDKKIKGHTKQECFTAYSTIKTALTDVMKYQTENEGDAGLQPLIDKLNKAYDNFVNTYGHFTKNNQLAWLRNDVDYPNVFSLEVYNEQGDGKGGVVKTYDKADVMKGRVVEKENEPHPENVKDGVVVSMFKNGRIDVPYIAGQLGMGEDAVKREIIESGLGFEDPTSRQMEVSYQYLSGNVREKLKQAEANNENGEYDKNIKALQEVVPMNIPAHLIDFTLGSSWLDPKLYNEYVKDRTDIDVQFTAAGGTWFMKELSYDVSGEKNRAMGVVSEMLKKTVMGHELIEAAIQNKTIVVSRTEKHYDGSTETITDREATSACAAKIDEIRQDFKDWARQKMQSDADLSARMEQEYNDRFNNYVPMSIPDDFVPEYFGGATHKFKMRPHQGKAIVRGTMQPLLLAHEVGTGKTFTLISTAMEMRRLGTAHKPMIVVQNATVGQFAASAKELYPNAKVLVLDDNDRNAEGRKNFYAKIKYNDWDMVIIPQSTLDKIPDSDERQMQFIQDKIDEKMLVLEQMRQADSSGRDPITRRAEKELADLQAQMAALSDDISKKRTANNEKKKAVAKQNAAVKAQEMLDRRTDDVENFDDMGIDALLIDEAHEYKHLGFATAMQRGVKGVDPSYSKKSQGVYLKTQAVLEKNNGRNVIFATGTPISNTAAEIWTFMRYLMPKDTMKEYGIYYFDDFVRNFGNIQQMPEFKTSGRFEEVNRFAGYTNMPELVRIWSSVSDTALTKEQTELVKKIPEMEGGKAQDIYLPQTRALRSVMKYVRDELKRFDEMSGKEKKANSSIPLTMYGIAQRAAVDARLVQVDAEDDPRSKTNEAVRQTLRSLKETDDYKGTVAIFADSYENKRSGFNLYEDIKRKLVEQGVPANEVVVMKAGMKIKQKLDIFDKVNRGEVRVVLGSTATLGTGVNIQERLHTLIHLDAPNRPMDYTQRNGRILRQGNLHKKWGKPVRVLRFGVEDSLDVTAYQRLKTKGAIADSVMEGDRLMQDSMNNRVLEEEEDVFGDTVAQLSGSEYALLKNNAEKNVRKYESRRRQWEADQTYIHNAKPKLEGKIKTAEQRAEEANAHLLAVQKAFPGGKFTDITIGKQKFTSVEGMTDFIKEHNKKILDAVKAMKENPGNSAQTNTLTLSLGGYDFVIKTEMSRETVNNGGSLFAEVHRKMTYSCPELGLTDIPVKQSLLRNAVEDITENVITGKDFAERFDIATRMAKRGKSELEQMKQREGKPFEFGKELEEAERQLEEYTEAMKQELAEKEKKYAEMDASVEAATDIVTDDEDDTTEDKTKFRLLEDDDPKAQELESLPDSELVPVYRNVQAFEDDALGSPMAFTDAETGERRTLQGQKWNYSNPPQIKLTPEQQRQLDELNKNGYIMVNGKKKTELPISEGLKFVKPKTKEAQLQYFLKKNPEDKGLWAAYDPYDHAIETPLNTQFGEAYKRPNLVVVRSLIPKSEIDEPFYADYALLPTGAHQWNNGRTLYLSRWSKIDKVLTREEEAKLIDEYWKKHHGKREALKSHRDYNRFVPQVRRELEKMGYRFELDGKELTPEESLALDKQNWENRDVIPGREGNVPFVSNEDIKRINAKMAGKWVGEPKEAIENAMTDRVNELADRLNTPVRIIRTDEEVAALPSTRQRRMKGSFNPLTGEVTIVVPNNANMTDVENTFIHEVVGHDGLRVLFPEEEKLNNALDELYRVSKDEIRNSIDRIAQKMYDAEVDRLREKKRKEHEAKGEDSNAAYYADMAEAHVEASKKREQFKRDATEEYGADLAGRIGEKGFEKMSAEELTFWGKLKSMLQKALQKLLEGLKIHGKKIWGDKEWAFVLHEAYKRKKNGGKLDVFDAADTEVMRRKTGFGETKFSDGEREKQTANERFNHELTRYQNGEMDKNEMLHLGRPQGVMRAFLPNLPIVMRQRVIKKGSEKKHEVDVSAIMNMPQHLSSPIFVFQRSEDTIGVLTDMRDRNGKNVCVAIELKRQIQQGAEYLEVNDVRSFHGREFKNIVEPIANNKTLKWVDKEKGLAYLSSASQPVQQEIDKQVLDTATKVVKDFVNPKVSDENVADNGIMFRDGDMGLDETITQMKIAASQANADNWQAKQEAMKAIGGNLNKLRQAMARQREYDLSTVKSITDLAKVLLDNGLLDDLSKYETKRILSAVNNAHGKQDTSNQVAKVMDIMVDNQLRMGANMLGRLLSTRGSRVDARGIEVQGQLDPDGQTIAQVVRKATSLPKADIEERIAEALNRMGSDDQAVADEAALEYSGLLLAHQFAEDITDSKAEEKALRDSIKQAKEDLDAGMMEKDAYNEYVAATNDAIRQNKIERAEAYRSIVEQVGSVLGGSVERAKQWREAEKQRVEAIHHNANSDMVGRPTDEHHKEGKEQKIANNSIVRFVLAPLGTFEQMLRMFGKKSVNGEGYLWNRYMRGWVDATEREYKGYQNALKTLDEKVSEVFGKKMQWGDLFAMERKMPKATVTFWDGGEQKDHELTQGNLLYIYMVDKMADGRMKLRRMGITEEDVENIKDFVDPRFLQLADWMQEEFLVGKRNEYNEVHKRMFGASMAAIENYFPLKILANARIEDVDVADDTTDTALPATSTGSIIKRRRNNLALDVMGADAFSVILDHIQQMERWAAFAEFNRDLNTLLSYKHFRNQVMNMSSVYGGGKTLWNNFRNVCSMAAGAYRPPIAQLDKAAVNIAKGVTAAKVSFRVFTALKQFLSMPAYLSDSNPIYLAANIANPIGAWKWSMQNLPLFEKRWKSRMAGDPRLMKSEMDWKMWRSHVVEIASRIGMSPNAFVDALTVAIGSHAMYQTKKQKYLRYGYDEEVAEKRAKQDATILFNQTQQSSESAFLSTMQVDRSWLSVLFTIFRNSSMSYTRQLYDAIRNIKHRFEPGYQSMSEEYMAKQMRRDGIDPDKADSNAKSEYRRSLLRDIARIGVFGYILQFAWNFGAYLPYLIAGDDKDEKSKMWDDVINHTMFGSIEGLTGGDVMSSAGQMALNGEAANWSYLVKDMPLASDLAAILQKMPKDKVAAMNDVVNLLVQSGVGVNPQSLTDAVVAIMDYCGDDAETSRECALLIARIINCPQSQTDKIYFDELGATAAEASKMTPAEIAERYAEYKIHRGAPLTGWAYSEEARDSVKTAQQNRVLTKAKEKMSNRMETEATKQLLSTFDEVSKQQTELSKLKKTDRAAYREGMKQLRQKYNMREHGRMKRYKHDMKLLTEKYLRSKSAEERDSLVRVMTTTRDKLLDDIGRMNQQ
ncbi:helicase-related protein [Phocaeicola plebeius]|uniref:MuF-C-terminal domain-containing protein n=1 Tax=Phocaeicola plebeius TaxID=310297 RepID=UPI003AB8EFDF